MASINKVVQGKVSFLTNHGKQSIVAPILMSAFNSSLVHIDKFDTDSLGTFDNKILRKYSVVKSALTKAYISCDLSGCTQGIGSEGSFNSLAGLGIIDEEVLAFVDVKLGIEIIASATQQVHLGPITALCPEDLTRQLSEYVSTESDDNNASSQKWILKDGNKWLKGLSGQEITSLVKTWPIYLEPDFRAMHCPQRQTVIASAMGDLVRRLSALCTLCHMPNFVEKAVLGDNTHLPCELCGQVTSQKIAPIVRCDTCTHSVEVEQKNITASAFYCSFCNP